MAFSGREKFKERKFSFKNKEKKAKKERDITKESPLKIILFSPLMFMGLFYNVIHRDNKKEKEENLSNIEDCTQNNINNKELDTPHKEVFKNNNITSNKQIYNKYKNTRVIQKRDETLSKNNSLKYTGFNNSQYSNNEKTIINTKPSNNMLVDIDKEVETKSLEKKILLKFQKKLNNLVTEIEVLESEEYLISKYANDHNRLEETIKIKKEIDSLIKKINEINEKYNLIKNNNLIKEPLLLEDSLLVDDIINYKEKLLNNNYNTISNNIKLLEEYNTLYTKTEDLTNKIEYLEEKTSERVEELSERNKNYKEAREKIADLGKVNNDCKNIIAGYQEYLKDICSKVDKIEEEKYYKYKLMGLNKFLSSSLKYIGYLTLTPLRGLIPTIAVKTMATRELTKKMYESIHYEKVEKIKYSLTNYQSEINNKIFDLDNLDKNIDDTLSDIEKLKKEFNIYFSKYNLQEYQDTYQKIIIMEENIIKNKKQLEIVKNKLTKSRELNKIKLKKINS